METTRLGAAEQKPKMAECASLFRPTLAFWVDLKNHSIFSAIILSIFFDKAHSSQICHLTNSCKF